MACIARPSIVPFRELLTRIDYNEHGQPLPVTERGWSPAFDARHPTSAMARSTRYTCRAINGRRLLAEIDGPLANGKSNSPLDSHITRIKYDGRGNYLIEIVAPGNEVTAITRSSESGLPLSVTNDDGARLLRTDLAYTADGSVRQITQTAHLIMSAPGTQPRPDEASTLRRLTAATYDPTGQLTALQLPALLRPIAPAGEANAPVPRQVQAEATAADRSGLQYRTGTVGSNSRKNRAGAVPCRVRQRRRDHACTPLA